MSISTVSLAFSTTAAAAAGYICRYDAAAAVVATSSPPPLAAGAGLAALATPAHARKASASTARTAKSLDEAIDDLDPK
jgi:hypothetical protein